MDVSLGAPPREVPAWESRALAFGHPLSLAGALALALAASLLWLFVAAYGLGFTALLKLAQPRLRLPAIARDTVTGRLPTGETTTVTTAAFVYQGQSYVVHSYSLASAPAPGAQVTVLAPRSSPEHGWIEGGQKFPLRLSALLKIAGVTLAPGAVLALAGLLVGLRQRRLLRHGVLVEARRVRQVGLARPFSDLSLDCYRVADPAGRSHTFWSVGADVPERTQALVSPRGWRGAVLPDRLLPNLGQRQGVVAGTGKGRRLSAWVVLLLTLGQAFLVLLFLLT